MNKKVFILLITIVVCLSVYQACFLSPAEPNPTVTLNPPIQHNLEAPKRFKLKAFNIDAVATYHIVARVLSTHEYWFDESSSVMPVDFALGWGPMSNTKILRQITITQGDHWYYWHTPKYPIPRHEIESNSANTHIIPANEKVSAQLKRVHKGAIIEMNGYLVNIAKENSQWRRATSMSRDDVNGGSCEIMYVQELKIL